VFLMSLIGLSFIALCLEVNAMDGPQILFRPKFANHKHDIAPPKNGDLPEREKSAGNKISQVDLDDVKRIHPPGQDRFDRAAIGEEVTLKINCPVKVWTKSGSGDEDWRSTPVEPNKTIVVKGHKRAGGVLEVFHVEGKFK